MLSKSLSTSQRFAQLFDIIPDLAEFAQSLYPLLVAHSDDFGRQAGDLFTIKHKVHPASPRDAQDFERALLAMAQVQLIAWYRVGDVECIQIVLFEKHQTGLHKRTRSEFPKPPADSGKFPESPEPGTSRKFRESPPQGPGNSRTTELNGTEPNRRDQDPQDQEPRAGARRAHLDVVPLSQVRSHLRSAAHAVLDDHPDAPDSELADALKDAAAKLRTPYHGREITNVIEAVRGERARRQA